MLTQAAPSNDPTCQAQTHNRVSIKTQYITSLNNKQLKTIDSEFSSSICAALGVSPSSLEGQLGRLGLRWASGDPQSF